MAKCHCLEPATFMVHAFPTLHAARRWNKGDYMRDGQHGMWACCDLHLTEAVKGVKDQVRHYPSKLIILVKEWKDSSE